jgi:hypothetical protein
VSVFILPEYVQSNTQIELKHTFQLVLLSSTSPTSYEMFLPKRANERERLTLSYIGIAAHIAFRWKI